MPHYYETAEERVERVVRERAATPRLDLAQTPIVWACGDCGGVRLCRCAGRAAKEPEYHAISRPPWEPGSLPTPGQLARLSPVCLTPEERDLVGQAALADALTVRPWPSEPE